MRETLKIVLTSIAGTTLLGAFGVASAATSSNTTVVPLNKPDIVHGQKISVGYQVGESIVYPGNGGFSILANPKIDWTKQAKQAYLNNHQAQRDLSTFLASPYGNSPEALQAKKPLLAVKSASDMTLTSSSTSNATLSSSATSLGSYSFGSGSYFTVNGQSNGGYVGDASTLETELGNASGTNLDWPFYWSSWAPYTSVVDLNGTPQSVSLQLTWSFAGVVGSVSYPPSVYPSSSGYVWSSGNQSTWDYNFSAPQGFITSSSSLASQTATSLQYAGTINVNSGGIINGYGGSHSEGWNDTGIWGDYWN